MLGSIDAENMQNNTPAYHAPAGTTTVSSIASLRSGHVLKNAAVDMHIARCDHTAEMEFPAPGAFPDGIESPKEAAEPPPRRRQLASKTYKYVTSFIPTLFWNRCCARPLA